jgi:hypothetical protein
MRYRVGCRDIAPGPVYDRPVGSQCSGVVVKRDFNGEKVLYFTENSRHEDVGFPQTHIVVGEVTLTEKCARELKKAFPGGSGNVADWPAAAALFECPAGMLTGTTLFQCPTWIRNDTALSECPTWIPTVIAMCECPAGIRTVTRIRFILFAPGEPSHYHLLPVP